MDAHNFAYWLNGWVELNGGAVPTEAQWKSIREHLALVFEKVKPAVGPTGIPGPYRTRPFDEKQLVSEWEDMFRRMQKQSPLPTVRCASGTAQTAQSTC